MVDKAFIVGFLVFFYFIFYIFYISLLSPSHHSLCILVWIFFSCVFFFPCPFFIIYWSSWKPNYIRDYLFIFWSIVWIHMEDFNSLFSLKREKEKKKKKNTQMDYWYSFHLNISPFLPFACRCLYLIFFSFLSFSFPTFSSSRYSIFSYIYRQTDGRKSKNIYINQSISQFVDHDQQAGGLLHKREEKEKDLHDQRSLIRWNPFFSSIMKLSTPLQLLRISASFHLSHLIPGFLLHDRLSFPCCGWPRRRHLFGWAASYMHT